MQELHDYLIAKGYEYRDNKGGYYLYINAANPLLKADVDKHLAAIGMRCPSHNGMGYRNLPSKTAGTTAYFSKDTGPYTTAVAYSQGTNDSARYVHLSIQTDKS